MRARSVYNARRAPVLRGVRARIRRISVGVSVLGRRGSATRSVGAGATATRAVGDGGTRAGPRRSLAALSPAVGTPTEAGGCVVVARTRFWKKSSSVRQWTRGRRFVVASRAKAARKCDNDPSAGSPTETLLRLLLPLDNQVWPSSRRQCHRDPKTPAARTNPRASLNHPIGSSDGRCVQRAGT